MRSRHARLAYLLFRGGRAALVAVGTLVTEGPVGAHIRGWSDTTARVAWTLIVAALAALAWGVWFEYGMVAVTCGVLLPPLALVTVFVHTVRAQVREEREVGALRLSRRGQRRAG